MGWCKLGADEGAQAVADLLMFNTTLASVDLRGNGLGDAGARSIWRWVVRSGAHPSGEGRQSLTCSCVLPCWPRSTCAATAWAMLVRYLSGSGCWGLALIPLVRAGRSPICSCQDPTRASVDLRGNGLGDAGVS